MKVWELAFDALFKKIREDLIDLIGKRRGQGDPVKIPGYVLLDIPIDYPYQEGSEFIFSERYLQCHGIGFSDDLFSEWQLAWGDLRIKRAQLLEHWPFGQGLSVAADRNGRKASDTPKKQKAFNGAPPKRRGPKESYDGELLYKVVEARLKSEGPFYSEDELIRWSTSRVCLKRGARVPKNKKRGDAPDRSTVAALITRHKILEIPNLITDCAPG